MVVDGFLPVFFGLGLVGGWRFFPLLSSCVITNQNTTRGFFFLKGLPAELTGKLDTVSISLDFRCDDDTILAYLLKFTYNLQVEIE